VQDEASQLVAALTGVRPGERVLDACAAPGGKSIVMAGMMQDQGLIVANDARPRRIALLARTIAASGAASIRITQADLASPPPFRTGFDCILIDAPCSGLGTLRRDPDIRWRRSERDLGRFADTQRSLLRHVAPLVAPGGRIVYSTCSSEPDENDDVVESFLESASGFELARSDAQHQRLAPGVAAVLDERGCLRTSPTKHGLEAFFGAVLRRRP
jgi:16S rRNA (cytosine967-C5)-methyltransferase